MYHKYKGGLYVSNKAPSGVRVLHMASACVTYTPFSSQWFCGGPFTCILCRVFTDSCKIYLQALAESHHVTKATPSLRGSSLYL